MQPSFMQAGPLSPSSGLFSYDAGDSQDDLFKYYLDVQAFQGKTLDPPMGSAPNNGTAITHPYASMEDSQTQSSTAYNAFFNPAALYANGAILNTLGHGNGNGNGNGNSITNNGTSTSPSASSSASLFPFADASQYMHSSTLQSPSTVDPSALLSSAHLNGSNNPINPSLLMGTGNSNSNTTTTTPPPAFQQQSISPNVPPVKLEEDGAVFTSLNQQEQANIESDDMDANEEQDDNDDDDDDSEEQDDIPLASVTRTRSSNAPAKRRAATKANATNKKTASSSTRSTTRVKESSVLSSSGTAHAGGHASHPHALVPVPEWEDRLSKQEYDKLSSKEKRQMRNKISARNFRHRRKAHIDTLEALVSEKEGVIDVLREEVGTLRTENSGLRADIEMLKKNWESIAAKISASATAAPLPSTSNSTAVGPSNMARDLQQLSPDEDDLYGAPGSLPALSPAASTSEGSTNGDVLSERSFEQPQASTSNTTARAQAGNNNNTHHAKRNTRSSNTIRPNLRKDVGRSGASFSSSFGGGRAMNVHTTLVPELTFNFPVPPDSMSSSSQVPSLTDGASRSSNTAPSSTGSRSGSPPSSNGQLHHSIADYLAGKRERDSMQTQPLQQQQRMNMNPALNGLTPEQIANLREQFFNSTSSSTMPNMQTSNSNAQIASGKLAQRSSALSLDPLQQSFFDANPFLSLRQDSLQDYRAQLYAKLANNVAGIQAQQQANASNNNNGQASAPVNGLRPAFFSNQISEEKTIAASAEMATIATIAQKTLFDKLSTAFWDAFAGPSPASQAKSMILPQSPTARRAAATATTANVDGDKVADVLAGRSRLQVVKNEQQAEVDELVCKIDSLGLKK